MPQKFYRTLYTWEILSDIPVTVSDPETLSAQTMDGDWSGMLQQVSSEEVSRERMAELLVAQGSDPEFLIMDDDDDSEEG